MRLMIMHLYFPLLVVLISQVQLEQKVLYNQPAESISVSIVKRSGSGKGVILRHLMNKQNEKLKNLYYTQSTLTKSGELVLPFKVGYLFRTSRADRRWKQR
ncbi:Zinc finger-like protein [Daphnia magna]|uniref:Zinc finger-like protein n=1 Tax=Daphnia magna TaxID=35525 RepID=A0A164FE17_9CRUS|nr:Zinc finger-like protein [Daphnia magna]